MNRKSRDIYTKGKRKDMICELTKKYGWKCWYCGYEFKKESEIHLDHIIPLSQKGKSNYTNLALSCKFCNLHKFTHSIEDFIAYLARIRSSAFSCPMLSQLSEKDIDPIVRDILQKSFY